MPVVDLKFPNRLSKKLYIKRLNKYSMKNTTNQNNKISIDNSIKPDQKAINSEPEFKTIQI